MTLFSNRFHQMIGYIILFIIAIACPPVAKFYLDNQIINKYKSSTDGTVVSNDPNNPNATICNAANCPSLTIKYTVDGKEYTFFRSNFKTNGIDFRQPGNNKPKIYYNPEDPTQSTIFSTIPSQNIRNVLYTIPFICFVLFLIDFFDLYSSVEKIQKFFYKKNQGF